MRFGTEYWVAIDAAILNCLESHSVVLKAPNKEKSLAAFVLVCPPTTPSKAAYGIEEFLPTNILEIAGSFQDQAFDQDFWEKGISLFPTALEIAFVATDIGWEGRGYARELLEAVLLRCITAQQPAWLHVDTVNEKTRAFYERLGFRNFLYTPDPCGSPGVIMIYVPADLKMPTRLSGLQALRPNWNHKTLKWPALLDTSPCETKEPLGRSILAPPCMAC
jgi:ribosomal protein S18 acetylase RimI-like enzyme